MTKTFLGLALASDLVNVKQAFEYNCELVNELRKNAKDDNETIERFQQLHNGLTREVSELTAKIVSLKQDLKDSEIWVTQLEESNKQQADLLGKQQAAIAKALDEANQAAMLRNEATVEISALNLENKRYRETVQMAIDNLALGIK